MTSFDLSTISEKQLADDAPVGDSKLGGKLGEWFLGWTTADGNFRQESITERPIKIGNSPRCEIALESSEAKPLHVVLSNNSESIIARSWVEDTLLNDKHFTTANLVDDDVLTVAGQQFKISFEEQTTGQFEYSSTITQSTTVVDENVFESELRDRIALNYQRIKNLVGTLRKERRDGIEASLRLTELEQTLIDLGTEFESVSNENVTLLSINSELEQALREAHEYLSSIKEQEVITKEENQEYHSPQETDSFEQIQEANESHLEDSEEAIISDTVVESDTNTLLFNDSYEELESDVSFGYEESAEPTEVSDFVSVDINPEYQSTEESLVNEVDSELTIDSKSSEDADLSSAEEETPNLEENLSSTWEVEELATESTNFIDEIATPDTSTEEDNRIDDLFGNHQEQEGENSQPYEPESFIDKYADLNDSVEDSSIASTGIENILSNSQPEYVEESVPVESDEDSSDESMDDYLNEMMARISGGRIPDSNKEPTNSGPSTTLTEPLDGPTSNTPIEEDELPKFQDLSELCKSLAPETGTDMQTLRSLANDSARKAIQTAQASQWKANILRKFGSVGIGLIGSVVGLITAPSFTSIQAILCFCLIAAWGYAGLQALISSQSDATLDIDLSAHLSKTKEA